MSYINRPAKGTAWRERVICNLVADVIIHEKLKTSLPIARRVARMFDKLIKWAKRNDLHSYRLALRYLVNKKHLGVMKKLFDLSERYRGRNSGYSRIEKEGYRRGDNSLRVILKLGDVPC